MEEEGDVENEIDRANHEYYPQVENGMESFIIHDPAQILWIDLRMSIGSGEAQKERT